MGTNKTSHIALRASGELTKQTTIALEASGGNNQNEPYSHVGIRREQAKQANIASGASGKNKITNANVAFGALGRNK